MTYSFMPQFAGMVKRGEKTSTIRAIGKRRPPIPGEKLRLSQGMRTKKYQVLRESVCVSCVSIHIGEHYTSVGGRVIFEAEADTIARFDGFVNSDQLRDFFRAVHGLPFEGWLITWRVP